MDGGNFFPSRLAEGGEKRRFSQQQEVRFCWLGASSSLLTDCALFAFSFELILLIVATDSLEQCCTKMLSICCSSKLKLIEKFNQKCAHHRRVEIVVDIPSLPPQFRSIEVDMG